MLAALPALTADDTDKRREVAEALFAANPEGAGSEHLRGRALGLLSDLYIGRGDEKAGEFLRGKLLEAVTEDHGLVHTAVVRQRETMNWGADAGEEAAVRARAIGLVEEVLCRALKQYTEIERSLRERGERPAETTPSSSAAAPRRRRSTPSPPRSTSPRAPTSARARRNPDSAPIAAATSTVRRAVCWTH
jgi:hypothetical protein